MLHRLRESKHTERNREQRFEAADLILNVCRSGTEKLAGGSLKILRTTTLRLKEAKKFPQNIQASKRLLVDTANHKRNSFHIFYGKVLSTTRGRGTENNLCKSRKTKELYRKLLFLAKDHQTVLQPCVDDLPSGHALHSKFCNDVCDGFKNHVCRLVYPNNFWNYWYNRNSSFCISSVRVITGNAATTSKSNEIVACVVCVLSLYFTLAFRGLLTDIRYNFAG